MRISISVLYIYIIIWVFEDGNGSNYCSDKPDGWGTIGVCTNSTIDSYVQNVYVDSGMAPLGQANECTCTIIPHSTNTIQIHVQAQFSLLSNSHVNITFGIGSLSLNYSMPETSSLIYHVDITGETNLKYSSSAINAGGVCLWIGDVTDADTFKMTCTRGTIHDTTSSANQHTSGPVIKLETDEENSGDEPTAQITTTISDHDTDASTTSETPQGGNQIDMTLIGAIVGSIVGVILIVLAVVLLVICCNRRRKSDSTETNDEDAYGIQVNTAYVCVGDVAPTAIDDPYTELDFTTKDLNSDYDYPSNTSANNKVFSQKTQHHDDDTYDHTVTSPSGHMTGNDYNHLPMSRHGTTSDNDDYNVLNHK